MFLEKIERLFQNICHATFTTMMCNITPICDDINSQDDYVDEPFEYDEEIVELAKKWGMPEQEIIDLFQHWEDNDIGGFYGLPWHDPDVPDEYGIDGGRFIDSYPENNYSGSCSSYITEDEESNINRFVENAIEHYNNGPLYQPVIAPNVLAFIDCKKKEDLRKEKMEKKDK